MRNIKKYFWNLNTAAFRQLPIVLGDPSHPKFPMRMTQLLSRCDRPKEVFSLISREDFLRAWPKIRTYWVKQERVSEFRDWWQGIYEEIAKAYGAAQQNPRGGAAGIFVKIGRILRQARVDKGMSQQALSLITGIPQPEISKIEEGKKNITLKTLSILCRRLDITRIDVG